MLRIGKRTCSSVLRSSRTVVQEGEVVGTANIFERDGRRLIGYFFGKNHWGKGIATRTVHDLLALDDSRPLFAFVAMPRSRRFACSKKIGFVQIEELPNRLNRITDVLLKLA